MATRGRPCQIEDRVLIRLNVSLYPEKDADLIAFFASIPKGRRVSAVKRALRSGGVEVVVAETQAADDQMREAMESFLL